MVKPYSFNELRIRVKRNERMLIEEEERRKLVNLDPLTLLWNRKKIIEFLDEKLALGLRNFHPAIVLLIPPACPLSHLEKDPLQALCSQLKQKIRYYDKAGRFGRREIMAILPQTFSKDIRKISKRLTESILLDSPYSANALPSYHIAIGGASSDLFLHPSTEAMVLACKKALNIALFLWYPNSIDIEN